MLVPKEAQFLFELSDLFGRFGVIIANPYKSTTLMWVLMPQTNFFQRSGVKFGYWDWQYCRDVLPTLTDHAARNPAMATDVMFFSELGSLLRKHNASINSCHWPENSGGAWKDGFGLRIEMDREYVDYGEMICYVVMDSKTLLDDAMEIIEEANARYEKRSQREESNVCAA
jgi:hypothetical protein